MWKKITRKYGTTFPYPFNITGEKLNLSTRNDFSNPSYGVAGGQLKLVQSKTGPGQVLAKALYHSGNFLILFPLIFT